jgi:hypothetical protein
MVMTVRELKEILSACNDDAIIIVKSDDYGLQHVKEQQVFAVPDGTRVIIDVDYYDYAEEN